MKLKESSSLAASISACGTSDFGNCLDTFCRLYASFDMSSIFVFFQGRRPIIVHDGYSVTVDKNALRLYLKGGYLLDPFYVASITNCVLGLCRMQELVPDNFHNSAFILSKEIHPCVSDVAGILVEEIGYIVNLGDGAIATYSLMRNCGGTRFDEREFTRLKSVEPIIASCIKQHWQFNNHCDLIPEKPCPERVFVSAFGGVLTETQRIVVQLILRGHSNASIAANLSISEGTAKNHRYHIYQRLNITSQTELFRLFVEYLIRE